MRDAATGAVTGAVAGWTAGEGAGWGAWTTFVVVDGAGVAAVVVVLAFCSTGAGFFASSGKSFGAAYAQSQRKPIEIRTAMKIRFSISRDGVPASSVQGVTAGQPAQAHPDAAKRSVLLDRMRHVHRAGRLEAAQRREQRRDE